MGLTKKQRSAIFAMFGGRCAYCGHVLPERGWHADHVKPVRREWWKATKWWQQRHGRQPIGMRRPKNDRLDNYFPSCRACNIDKSCLSLEAWRAGLEREPQVLRDNYSAWRHAERFGLVQVVKTRVVFYFEQLAEASGTAEVVETPNEPASAPEIDVQQTNVGLATIASEEMRAQ